MQFGHAARSKGRDLEICSLAGSSSLGPGDQIALSHWLCPAGPSVTSVCISPTAQLVAVGLGSGEVALHRLWGGPGSEPLRTISLREWGYEPETTGSVSDLQWSPDSRALAVSSLTLTSHANDTSLGDNSKLLLGDPLCNVQGILPLKHRAISKFPQP